jgi:type VI secretion system protein ImpK
MIGPERRNMPASGPPRHGEGFLVRQFRDFYREVIRLKGQVQRGEWVFGDADRPDGAGDGPDHGPSRGPSAVWQTLLTVLERQALAARRGGGDYASAVYREAQFVMVALADEIFLHLDWPGREAWQENLLESKLFQSHRAGEVAFERIDEILRNRQVLYIELASLYLMALALGFEGRYRGRPDGAAELASYRHKLFQFVFSREPELFRGRQRLIPQAYGNTIEVGGGKRLPYLKRWLWGFAALLLLWILVGHQTWTELVSPMRGPIHDITSSRP